MHVGLICRNDVDSCIDLANVLLNAGASVTLYMSESHLRMAVDTPDRPVERLYELGILLDGCKVRLRKIPRMRHPLSVAMVWELAKTIRKDGIDVAHILMGPGEIWLAVLTAVLRRIPVTSTMVIPTPNPGEELPAWVVYGAHKVLAFFSDLIIVNGANQAELVQELYGIPRTRIVHIPLCPRTTAVRWSGNNKNGEGSDTILFFGEARHHKGLEYLVKAQPQISLLHPRANILIASRGTELARCRRMISDETRFEIHDGYFSGDVMAEFFRRASVVVLPYLSASTSGILLTAYGFGKPVVASNVGCLPEYVTDGVTGYLVQPANTDKLAAAIADLLSSDERRKRMGSNAKAWVENRASSVAAETLAAYEKAIVSNNTTQESHRSNGKPLYHKVIDFLTATARD